jgi:hypothetical protein
MIAMGDSILTIRVVRRGSRFAEAVKAVENAPARIGDVEQAFA